MVGPVVIYDGRGSGRYVGGVRQPESSYPMSVEDVVKLLTQAKRRAYRYQRYDETAAIAMAIDALYERAWRSGERQESETERCVITSS